ncbi:MAG: NAD(P)-dependent oxidoreductase [Verrucomicrobiota bacterium]
MKVGITGGLGFVGTNFAREALQSGWVEEFVVLDNLTNPSGDFPGSVDGMQVLEGDIRSQADVDALCGAGIDVLVHLAGHTRVMDSIEDPMLNFQINVDGTVKLLESCRQKGVQKVVIASTGGAILGEVPPPIHEEIAAKPAAPYGASKLACEGYGWAYSQSFGMNVVSLRFSNLYGPFCRRKKSVVAAFSSTTI